MSVAPLTIEQAARAKIGLAAAQTAYALNNGHSLQVGAPLGRTTLWPEQRSKSADPAMALLLLRTSLAICF
jgi:hypothetical protein